MNAGDLLKRIYLTASRLFPPTFVAGVSHLIEQMGLPRQAARSYLGFSIFLAIGAGLITFFLAPIFLQIPVEYHALIAVAAAAIVLALFQAYLVTVADSRAEQIETVLPDALQIISSNIRAGMTLENAFWSAARPEFGPLKDEIKKVSAQTIGGRPFREALLEMRQRVRSQLLERSIRLIVEGIALGGEMAKLLEEVGKDIRNTQLLRREIGTQTMMYTMFILFASVLVSPLLFSIAVYYSEVSERLEAKSAEAQKQAGAGGAAGLPGGSIGMSAGAKRSPDRINAQDIQWFAIAAICVTNMFSALLIGGIRTGKRGSGLKYVIIFVLISLGIFTAAHGGLAAALGGIGR